MLRLYSNTLDNQKQKNYFLQKPINLGFCC
nr:MAG TPA: hypothetical protein [Caudoviricetes sp.]